MFKGRLLRKISALAMVCLMIIGLGSFAQAEGGQQVEYTVNYWVEIADIAGDPGDPMTAMEDAENFMLYKQQVFEGAAGSTVELTAELIGEHLYSPERNRRFASFLSGETGAISADGSAVLNAYYARDAFTYEFDIVNDKGEMTITGETYRGGSADKYTVMGKFEQQVIIPGIENGLMPVSTDESQGDIYCAGWALDPRTGEKGLMTYAHKITEVMLPTDDMPYEDLVFELSATWYNAAEQSLLVCWYEQLPDEVNAERNRMTYNGKVYVNYPTANFEFTAPKGSAPSASSAPGLIYLSRIDADSSKEGIEGRTWQFIYDRDRFDITFDTGGVGNMESARNVMYQQNLYFLDPGWNEGTNITEGSTTYTFAGWYTEDGSFAGYSLVNLYMPARNVRLSARWEKAS